MLQKKLLTAQPTHFPLNLITPDGRRIPVSVSSAPLEQGGQITGAFGLFTIARDDDAPALPAGCTLTSRQHELLTLLGEGASTSDIATKLSLSEHTVRNHIRQILRRLGANSRIAAVAVARKHGLL